MNLSRLPDGFDLDTAVRAYALGAPAVSRVQCEWTERGWRTRGQVTEGGQLYNAAAELSLPPQPQLLGTRCSCGQPVCQHAAALVLMSDPPTGAPPAALQGEPLDPRLRQWLASFTPPEDTSSGRGRQYELRFVMTVAQVNLQGGFPGQTRRAVLDVVRVPLKGGEPQTGAAEPYPLTRKVGVPPSFVQRDADALELLSVATRPARLSGKWQETLYAVSDHPATNLLLASLLETGRLCWEDAASPLSAAPPRPAQPGWDTDASGMQRPSLVVEGLPGAVVLPLSQPWVLDPARLTLGRAEVDTPPEVLSRFLTGPMVSAPQVPALARALAATTLPLPSPVSLQLREETLPFTPELRLSGRTLSYQDPAGSGRQRSQVFPVAELRLAYGGLELPDPGSRDKVVTLRRGHWAIKTPRQPAQEKAARRHLRAAGFRPLTEDHPDLALPESAGPLLTLGGDEAWLDFLAVGRDDLQEAGLPTVIDESFPLTFAEVDDWYGETEERGGWFTLDLGIIVDGQRIGLLPILADLIASQPELFTAEALAGLGDDELIFAGLPDGRKVPLPAGRVRAILGVLVELHLRERPSGPLRLPLLDAARLAELEGLLRARWVGADRLLALGQKLRDFAGVSPVEPPAGLRAELRPYQLQGLAWLQFLREYEMGGILADDMGLGKTLQTLAHILTEHEAGRADLPTLVIAPTSVIGNWAAEAERFTPGLRVLTLHGKDRHAEFARVPESDLVLTTYPLLPRDIDALREHRYHLVILDEAQNIKNNKTAAAKAAGSLDARHRLCLTGTPLENHLGELWSQFNFLSPGLLHDERTFQQLYRTPIEKKGDPARRAALAARVRPFILRREKRDVARELPPKTEIPVRVTLEGDQRDLYETVRVTMQSRVREELAARGLARSTIAILDALLKLRQAVTDPRLVKLEAARQVGGNAKLEWLESHLPQMVAEGRRVLIFSGFATLLGHLEGLLERYDIPYSKITGQTKSRQKQIDDFQGGLTQVFLITLKAGGVGLNLTAADTVIHYDPWWNPAAEDQATDRAYRIGQDKPVFVYKLIAAGSVEERILDLQARKAALARGVLDGGLTDAAQLSLQDLDHLLAPLEDGEDEAG